MQQMQKHEVPSSLIIVSWDFSSIIVIMTLLRTYQRFLSVSILTMVLISLGLLALLVRQHVA